MKQATIRLIYEKSTRYLKSCQISAVVNKYVSCDIVPLMLMLLHKLSTFVT